MCKQVFRVCLYCGYHRHGWWESCTLYFKVYRHAIHPLIDPEERPPKPKEEDCPFREEETQPFSFGGCNNMSCPAKPLHKERLEEIERCKKRAEEAKEEEIERFNKTWLRKFPVKGFKKTTTHVVAGRRPVEKKTTVAMHQEAREALRQMMQNINMEDANTFESDSDSDSFVDEPPVMKKNHVRGGYMMKRESARRPVALKLPTANNGDAKGAGIMIPCVTPTAVTDTIVSPKNAELSAPKSITLAKNLTHLSMASATSPEASPTRSDGQSIKSDASSHCREDFAHTWSRHALPNLAHLASNVAAPKKVLVQPPPGLGFTNARTKDARDVPIGFEDVLNENKEAPAKVPYHPSAIRFEKVQSRTINTPPNVPGLLSQELYKSGNVQSGHSGKRRDVQQYEKRIINKKTAKDFPDMDFFRPQLPDTRPRYYKITAHDQLHGFFGRTAPDPAPGSDEPCKLGPHFPMIFGDSLFRVGLRQSN